MIENPYAVGDTVLAARNQDGENHEEAKIVDAYSLIMGDDERPMVCAEFEDGQRVYVRSDGPDVLPLLQPEDAEVEPGSEDPAS